MLHYSLYAAFKKDFSSYDRVFWTVRGHYEEEEEEEEEEE
jgi:hypothetical protein